MMRKKVTDYALYRWRFIIGYSVIALCIVTLLLVASFLVPGGISEQEKSSAIASSALSFSSFSPEMIVHLPYHLLQKASISLFGLSEISIKLPSLILAIASAVGMVTLLRAWFRPNIAILATIIVITTGQFLFVSQSGSPSIIYIFWSVWLLASALMVSRRAKGLLAWKIALFSLAALSLYTPLSIYMLVALLSAALLHPHLRYLIRQMLSNKGRVSVASIVALCLMAPLAYAIYKDTSVGLLLLGVPDVWPQLMHNISELTNYYFDFISPGSGIIMKPVYGLGTLGLIVIGLVKLVTTNYTARSYIITAWSVLLLPVLIINPSYITITFIPAMLLVAMGVESLLQYWYTLFPRNPYARIVGIIPLTVLITGMTLSGVGRFMYGYTYDPQTAGHFSQDLRLLNTELSNQATTPITIVTTNAESSFYKLLANRYPSVDISATPPEKSGQKTIISHAAYHQQQQPDREVERILTDKSSSKADRFYIYN